MIARATLQPQTFTLMPWKRLLNSLLPCWHKQAPKQSVNALETTALLILYAIQKLVNRLFLALCVWYLKKILILRLRDWISLVLPQRRLCRGLEYNPRGSVAMCSTKACGAAFMMCCTWIYSLYTTTNSYAIWLYHNVQRCTSSSL